MSKQIAKTAKKKPTTKKTHRTPKSEFSPQEVLTRYLLESSALEGMFGDLNERIAAMAVSQFPDVKTLTERQLDVDGCWFDTDLWEDIEYTTHQLIRAMMRNVFSEKFVPRVRLECPYEPPTKRRRS